MGLDNYWKSRNGRMGKIEKNFLVWGGMLSGNGEASFRGKVYADIVEEATGISLYDAHISNKTVRVMADKLDAFDFSNVSYNPYDLTVKDFESFKEMFRCHAEAGHSLKSWY